MVFLQGQPRDASPLRMCRSGAGEGHGVWVAPSSGVVEGGSSPILPRAPRDLPSPDVAPRFLGPPSICSSPGPPEHPEQGRGKALGWKNLEEEFNLTPDLHLHQFFHLPPCRAEPGDRHCLQAQALGSQPCHARERYPAWVLPCSRRQMLLQEEPALDFQQPSAFPACSFFPEPGETPRISSSEWFSQAPVSISHACSLLCPQIRSTQLGSLRLSLPFPFPSPLESGFRDQKYYWLFLKHRLSPLSSSSR